MHSQLQDAERIYCIAFGFDEINMDLLRLGEHYPNATIRATAYGMTAHERAPVERRFGLNKVHLYPDWKGLDFVRNVDLVHD